MAIDKADPAVWLSRQKSKNARSLPEHDQLANIAFLMESQVLGSTNPEIIQSAMSNWDDISEHKMLHYLIQSFSDRRISGATPLAINGFKRRSPGILRKWIWYLMGLQIQATDLPQALMDTVDATDANPTPMAG